MQPNRRISVANCPASNDAGALLPCLPQTTAAPNHLNSMAGAAT